MGSKVSALHGVAETSYCDVRIVGAMRSGKSALRMQLHYWWSGGMLQPHVCQMLARQMSALFQETDSVYLFALIMKRWRETGIARAPPMEVVRRIMRLARRTPNREYWRHRRDMLDRNTAVSELGVAVTLGDAVRLGLSRPMIEFRPVELTFRLMEGPDSSVGTTDEFIFFCYDCTQDFAQQMTLFEGTLARSRPFLGVQVIISKADLWSRQDDRQTNLRSLNLKIHGKLSPLVSFRLTSDALAGIIAGSILVVALLITIIVCLIARSRRNKYSEI